MFSILKIQIIEVYGRAFKEWEKIQVRDRIKQVHHTEIAELIKERFCEERYFSFIDGLDGGISSGRKYLMLRKKYFEVLNSFIVISQGSDSIVRHLNNIIRSSCESLWAIGGAGLCFHNNGVMSENGFYFKERDKVLAVYPEGFSEFGNITAIYPKGRKCELHIPDTGERLEHSFVSKSPELLPGFAVRKAALIGKKTKYLYVI